MFREIDGIKKGPILMWPPGVVVLAAIVPLNMKCSVGNAEGCFTRTAFGSILFETAPSFSIIG